MLSFFDHLRRQIGGQSKEIFAWNRSINRESLEQERLLNQPWDQLLVSAIDSETTGFHPEAGDEMISVAAVKWKGVRVEVPFHSYIQIEKTLPPHITELTGIEESDLSGAPSIQIVIQDFLKYVDSTVLIGYYIGHDISFLNYFLWKKFRTRINHRVLEVKTIIELLYPQWESFSFDDLCETLGIVNTGRHTAIGDALAVAELWSQLVQKLDQVGIHHLAGLYEQLAQHRRGKG
ncbi:MAG TPA: exonuclease domain-containing protein [Bacillota bacterium]|nr:exonuclease domain-containing protein [Bacillota bacterium]